MSSIFISLLRYKKIPARHVVAMRPDGSYHVWAEFYLENYGWVPVDVTFKMSSPSRNYFGYCDGNCIVVNNNVHMLLDRGDGYTFYCPLLQTMICLYWSSGSGSADFYHDLNGAPTSVETFAARPDQFFLYPAFPNPFNSATTSGYELKTDGFVALDIYNSLGQHVFSLVNDFQSTGEHRMRWEPGNLSSGMYLLHFKAGNIVKTGKLMYLR